MLTIKQMVQYLRLNVNVQVPSEDEGTVIDPSFLSLTDEDLELYLNIALSQGSFASMSNIPGLIPTLETVPQSMVYLLILFAKKELYFALATKVSPQMDIGADNNNYLKRDQRFQHYMKLIQQTDEEIKAAFDDADGGGGTGGFVQTYDTLVSNRYFTKYNHDHGNSPRVQAVLDAVGEESVERFWMTSYISQFLMARVWYGTEPILDVYNTQAPVKKDLKPYKVLKDPHQTMIRLENLEIETTYYVVIAVTTKSGLTGYCEILVTTLPDSSQGGDG